MDNLAVDLTPEVESQSLAIPEQAQAMVINSKESMTRANDFRKNVIRALIKEIDETFEPTNKKLLEAKQINYAKWQEKKKINMLI